MRVTSARTFKSFTARGGCASHRRIQLPVSPWSRTTPKSGALHRQQRVRDSCAPDSRRLNRQLRSCHSPCSEMHFFFRPAARVTLGPGILRSVYFNLPFFSSASRSSPAPEFMRFFELFQNSRIGQFDADSRAILAFPGTSLFWLLESNEHLSFLIIHLGRTIGILTTDIGFAEITAMKLTPSINKLPIILCRRYIQYPWSV